MNFKQKTQEQIINEIEIKIEEIYQRKDKDGKPKGKGFVTHLLCSYLPVQNINKVWDSKDNNLRCAITGTKLCTIEDAFQVLHSEGMDKKILDHMRSTLAGEVGVSPMKEELKGKVIAHTGKDTTTMLCLVGILALIQWYQNKILQKDKHVVWVANEIMRKNAPKPIKKERAPETEEEKNNRIAREEEVEKEKAARKFKKTTTSLGDMSALQKLKEKMMQEKEIQNLEDGKDN